MKTSIKSGRKRMQLAALATVLAMGSAGAMASDDTVFNLVHYQVSFGFGVPQHNPYLASNARYDAELAAYGHSGQVRLPLLSGNPRSWKLFNSDPGSEDGGSGLIWRGVAGFLAALGVIGLGLYGTCTDYKACREEHSEGACNSDFIAASLTTKR